jgi:DNA-binding CsgD family transcriptional regulator
MGQLPDAQVAARAGVSAIAVSAERRRRGIAGRRGPVVEWSEDMVSRLGTDTDAAIAEELRLSASSVAYKRRRLGIRAYGPDSGGPRPRVRWRRSMLALLGKAPDREVAKRLGLTREQVWWKRQQLGIRSFVPPPRPVEWPRWALRLLGWRHTEIARRLGIQPKTVLAKRQQLGIPAFAEERPIVRTKALKRLLALPNRVLVREHGLSVSMIGRLRREYGVRAPGSQPPRWTGEVVARLGREPDAVIARELGIARHSVLSKRRTLGIPALTDARWRRRRKQVGGARR